MNLPVALIVIPGLFDERRQSVSALGGERPAKSDRQGRDFHCQYDPSLRIQRERRIVQCRHRAGSRIGGLPECGFGGLPILRAKRGIAKSQQDQLIVRPLRPAFRLLAAAQVRRKQCLCPWCKAWLQVWPPRIEIRPGGGNANC